jgi:hypothetical protein
MNSAAAANPANGSTTNEIKANGNGSSLAIVVAAWQESSLNAQIIYSLNPKVK